MGELDQLTRLYELISSTLNETDRMTLDEKYTIVKDKYNRLLDGLTQRVALLDEATRMYRISVYILHTLFLFVKVNERNTMIRTIVFKNSIRNYIRNL